MLYYLNFLLCSYMLTLIHFCLPSWQTKVASDSVYGIISGVSYHVPYTEVTNSDQVQLTFVVIALGVYNLQLSNHGNAPHPRMQSENSKVKGLTG